MVVIKSVLCHTTFVSTDNDACYGVQMSYDGAHILSTEPIKSMRTRVLGNVAWQLKKIVLE